MQRKIAALDKISKSIGLKIHPAKSKVLKVESKSSEQVRLNGHPFEEVDSFCYLRSMIDKNGEREADLKPRKHKQHLPHCVLSGRLKKYRLEWN